MTQFSKELIELYNLASARLYKLSAQINFFQPRAFMRALFLKIAISITSLSEKTILTMNTIFQRTNRTLELGFSNALQIMSANAISRHLFFTRGIYLEMEIRITFLHEKQFQQMTPFSEELIAFYNSASATLYKLCAQTQFFQPRVFTRALFLKIAISITFIDENQF